MAVTVRMFAALREAAGTTETEADAGPLPAILEQLENRYGEPFTSRLRLATVLLDGDARDHDDPVEVADGAELALLPPFSGGVLPILTDGVAPARERTAP